MIGQVITLAILVATVWTTLAILLGLLLGLWLATRERSNQPLEQRPCDPENNYCQAFAGDYVICPPELSERERSC